MATLSVLFGAMAPTISAAFGLHNGAGVGQICSVQTELESAQRQTPDRRDSSPGIDHLFEHCPYCSLHVVHLGMPPAVVTTSVLALTFARHRYYLAAAPTLRTWSNARSRAPPQVA
jgi:Protein of unknown function (DUF2946)